MRRASSRSTTVLRPNTAFRRRVHDALAGYRWLLAAGIPPQSIVIAGDSAGGGLALSTLLALRDAHEPAPAGAVLIAPWVDLATTLVTSTRGEGRIAHAYVGDAPFDDPLASGLYADLHGLPPLMIQASTMERLCDDAVRLDAKARAAGVDSTLRSVGRRASRLAHFCRIARSRAKPFPTSPVSSTA